LQRNRDSPASVFVLQEEHTFGNFSVTFLHKRHSFALFEVNSEWSRLFLETDFWTRNYVLLMSRTKIFPFLWLFSYFRIIMGNHVSFIFMYNTIQKVRRIVVKTAQRNLDVFVVSSFWSALRYLKLYLENIFFVHKSLQML
jgi:REP element-mobilizing transposase RayT